METSPIVKLTLEDFDNRKLQRLMYWVGSGNVAAVYTLNGQKVLLNREKLQTILNGGFILLPAPDPYVVD